MKEVARIHIAKVSYEIEIGAKKELETYLKALESYSGDADILTDVEIRITEILDERGVKKNGVITHDDVEALKEQLGEPSEFKDDDKAAPEAVEAEDYASRKLYRDTDRAVFGGVLAGVAAFFKVNPALVRVLFIIVALASFGTALLVYVVLWIAVPPARTAADKLQMVGRPVTVESIREFNENDDGKKPVQPGANRRVWAVLGGIVCVMGAGVSAMITLMGVFAVIFGGHHVFDAGTGAQYLMSAFWLAVASGTLLTILFILGAYASFAQKLTKRVLVSICIVIVAGLVSFGGAIGLAKYGSYQHGSYIDANTRSQAVAMPAKTSTISALALDTHGVQVEYHATSSKPYATLRAVAKEQADMPSVQMEIDGTVLKVSAEQKSEEMCHDRLWWCGAPQPTLEIYGPAVTALSTADDAVASYYPDESQKALLVTAKDNAAVDIASGTIQNVTVNAGEDSTVSFTQATIYNLVVASIRSSSSVEAGTVRTLDVKDEGSCPSRVRSARVSVWKVTDGMMSFNGQKKPAATMDSGCTEIDIEGEEDAQ